MPQQWDTRVGDGGGLLSGGERLRLTIARALAKDAPILLLDEATAALDADNEQHLQALWRELRGRKTVVVFAHRLSSIIDADRIVVMDDGRVAAVGRHEALIEDCLLYRRLGENHCEARGWTL